MKFNWNNFGWRELATHTLIGLGIASFFYRLSVNWVLSGVLGLGAAWAGGMANRKYAAALLQRIEGHNPVTWDVELSGVNVGTITDAKYAEIRLRVFQDVRTYRAQVMNIGWVVLRVSRYLVTGIPIFVFWIVLVLAVLAPENFSSLVAAVQKAGPSGVAHVASTFGVQLLGLAMFLIFGLQWMIGVRFGFINRFAEATAQAVREHCGVAAEGSFVLVRYDAGGAHFNDEGFYVRNAKTL